MNIEYLGRGYNLDDGVRDHVEDKLGKVEKFLEEPVEVRVTLEVEKNRQIADIHIHHRHGVLQAKEEALDMRDALNSSVAKVEKQARRSRKKLTGRKRRAEPTNHWPLDIVERTSLARDASDGPRVIRSTHLKIKPMTIDEAALELEGSKNDFVVFRNSSTEKVNVLYKRKDENYGLIAPEL